MEDTIKISRIQYLSEFTAKSLYNLARNIFENEEEALLASVDAFVDAFVKTKEKKDVPDAELFKTLSIRYLYVYGKRRQKAGHMQIVTRPENPKAQAGYGFLNRLNLLRYDERFILLLFCCQKMKIRTISQVLRLPGFLVTRRLLSAVQKINGA